MSKYNLDDMTAAIKKNVNERLGSPLIQDVLIDELNYVDKDTLKQQADKTTESRLTLRPAEKPTGSDRNSYMTALAPRPSPGAPEPTSPAQSLARRGRRQHRRHRRARCGCWRPWSTFPRRHLGLRHRSQHGLLQPAATRFPRIFRRPVQRRVSAARRNLPLQRERGEYGPGDIDAHVQLRLDLARQQRAHVFERTRPNGKILEIRGVPLAGGGFVTTYLDVTEQRQTRPWWPTWRITTS